MAYCLKIPILVLNALQSCALFISQELLDFSAIIEQVAAMGDTVTPTATFINA